MRKQLEERIAAKEGGEADGGGEESSGRKVAGVEEVEGGRLGGGDEEQQRGNKRTKQHGLSSDGKPRLDAHLLMCHPFCCFAWKGSVGCGVCIVLAVRYPSTWGASKVPTVLPKCPSLPMVHTMDSIVCNAFFR